MTAFKYQPPGLFAAIANAPLGLDLWDFVNDPANVSAMVAASHRGRPAVEAIAKPLLNTLGAKVKPAQIKQMIGHMVRQVMEHQGFIHHKHGVKINSVLFSKGSLYRRPSYLTASRAGNVLRGPGSAPSRPPGRRWPKRSRTRRNP